MSDTPPYQRFLDDHRDDVWRFLVASVGRNEADDCFQETFLSALRAYPRLRPGSNLRAWVLTIAHRKALDAHRRRARNPVPVEDVEPLDGRVARPAELPDERLWAAVRELSPGQRAAVILRHVADMSHREIAEVTGGSEEAARRALADGLDKLREVYTP